MCLDERNTDSRLRVPAARRNAQSPARLVRRHFFNPGSRARQASQVARAILASALEATGDVDRAEATLKDLLKENPNAPGVLIQLGQAADRGLQFLFQDPDRGTLLLATAFHVMQICGRFGSSFGPATGFARFPISAIPGGSQHAQSAAIGANHRQLRGKVLPAGDHLKEFAQAERDLISAWGPDRRNCVSLRIIK